MKINLRAFAILMTCSLVSETMPAADDAGVPDAGPAVTRITSVYKTVGRTKLKMFTTLPSTPAPEGGRSAIVFFFGGAWIIGTPEQFEQRCLHYAKLGMVAFAPDYRVYSRQRTLPFSAVSDAKSAIRWVRAHATEFGINPDRIVAAGGSAGGHISACAAIIEDFEDPGQDLTVSSRPNALVLFNPALDTSPIAGSVGELKMAAASSISPVDHIRGGLPPTIVFHGTADESCPYENSERFCRLMKEAGNDCELFGYEGATHGFHNHSSFRKEGKGDNKYYFDTLAKTDAFLERIGFLPKPPRAAEEKKDQ